ncbi:MAG: NADH-quinone oxidoreductase subunit C [Chloroflexi bacterium]|nr:MAG: NADH-quinone oxidoreductase subunit C [Chloroflexota bacterium]
MIPETMTVDKGVTAGDAWVTVAPANIHAALSALKDGGYRLLVFLTCVDHLADSSREWPARYEIVYQLRDMETRDQLRVRTFIDGDPPHIESAYDLFPPANWDERETYDIQDRGAGRLRRRAPDHQLRPPPSLDARGAPADRRPRR